MKEGESGIYSTVWRLFCGMLYRAITYSNKGVSASTSLTLIQSSVILIPNAALICTYGDSRENHLTVPENACFSLCCSSARCASRRGRSALTLSHQKRYGIAPNTVSRCRLSFWIMFPQLFSESLKNSHKLVFRFD